MKSKSNRPTAQRASSSSLGFNLRVVGKRLTSVALAAIGIMGNFAHAAPADIVTSAAPAMGADAPNGSAISGAEASVATQTGSLQYAYPIAMPPGRNGMVPSLALTYSSQGSIYGGIAAGWSLDVPIIKKDTSKSALATSGMADQDLVAAGGDARDNDMFVSGLAGGRPLVRVTEAGDSGTFRTYRAQNDNSGARYERMTPAAGFRWRVRTNDGATHYFGTPAQFDGCNVSDDYAPLTSSRDAFGNEIVYSYIGTAYGECLLSKIEYGRNGTISHHATVSLTWDSELVCTPTIGTMANGTTPVGAQLDYRDGNKRMFGTKALSKIEVQVAGTARTHYRAITLSYLTPGAVSSGVAVAPSGIGATCSAAFAPYRQLVAIDEEATSNGDPSTKVNLPRVTFSYGNADIARATSRASLLPPGGTSTEYSAGLRYRDSLQRWPRVDRMMLDLDGDGRPDQLESESVGNECKVKWWRNTTTGWQTKSSITLPRLPWSGSTGNKTGNDSCALNAQLTFVDNGGTEGGCGGARDKTGSYLPYRWIDMDGDSLPDLVTAIHYDGDQFDPNIGTFPLPQAPTCGVLPPPSTCIAVREIDIGSDGGETCGALGCTINYATFKTVEVAGLTKSPYCPRQNGQLARQCIAGQSGAGSTCGRDLLGSCASDPTLVVVDGMAAGTQSGCSFQEPINPDPPMHCGKATKPYGKCGGYPWWIYKNLGNGQLASTATVRIQPQPLESDGADSTLVGNVRSLGEGMADIDGDGLVDLLAIASSDASTHPKLAQSANPTQTQTIQAQPGYWQVFPNNGVGQFVTERPGLHAHLFRTPRNAEISRSSYETAGGAELSQTALLTDLNGDGLPDYLAVNSTWLNAEYVVSPLKGGFNNGLGISESAVGAPSVSGIPSIGRAHVSATSFEPPVLVAGQLVSPGWLISGERELWSRLVDTDADGRQDLIIRDAAWASPFVSHFNLGGVFSNLGFGVSNAVRNKVTTSSVSTNEVSSWQTRSDLVDLDGDGISEAIDYDVSGGIVKGYDPAGHPPRLLYQISNGRGATTTVTYGAVSNVVSQDTANGYRMPHAMWVVTNLSTTDVFAGTTTSSGTAYADPAFTQDPPTTNPADHGKWNFRGFRKVTTTSPTGAQTIQKYQYGGVGESLSPDWSGRLVETQVIPAEAPTNVRSISRTAYEGRTSFGGAITTYHPVEERKYTCANGQDVTTCLATPAGFSRTASTLTAFPSAVAPEMWTATASTQQGAASLGNPAFVDGDRQTVGTFTYVSNSTTYRFRQTASESAIKVSGALVPFARSETDWDTALNLPMKQRSFFSAGAADYGETRYEYNALGQVTKRYKPMQSGVGSTVYAENVYDAPYSLFVVSEINELGHVVDKDYDYGTGAVIATRGPNVRTCVTACTGPLKEEHLTKVDGIGRPMEESVTLSDDGYQYSTAKITEYKYFDVPTFGGTPVPASMTTYKIIEATFTAWTGATAATGTVATVRSDYDGSGRLTRTVQLANGAAAANAVTSYLYGNDGKLISVSTPDPTLNTSAQVTTTYSFDSIGRPTGMRLPDNAVAANRSGVDMAYNGRTSTTTEVVGAAGKPAPVLPDLPTPVASTVSTVDDFGRLITVTERRAETGPGQWATTQYTYSPRNEMATITEPQGIVTTLVHDFAGHRTSINRDGKVWNYTYDKNGNMLAEQVPYPSGALAADYTNLQTYDALDRSVTKTIGQRNLNTADQALFGTRTYTFTWDLGGNRVGRLKDVSAYPPSSTTYSVALQYNYDALGNRTNTLEALRVAGFPMMQRTFFQTYTPHFGPRLTKFNDGFAANNTWTQTYYDGRGMPKRIDLNRTVGATAQQMAVQTRNVAGLVTKRRTDQLAATGTMPWVESNWVYDSLGRPLSQTVQNGAGASTVQVAKQQLAYYGTGDVKQLIHTLGASNTKTFNFEFDARHQLTRVKAGTAFDSTYTFGDPALAAVTPGNSGRFTKVKIAANTALPGSDVKPREVNYVYGTGGAAGVDKEAVTTLTNVAGGATFASYEYDSAGNQTSRTYTAGNERWDYVYDGEDNLRRVTKKVAGVVSGSEEYWYDESGGRMAIVYRNPAGVKTGLRWFIGGTEAYYTAGGTGANTATLSKVYSHPSLGTPVARVERTSDTVTKVEYQFHGLASNTLAAVASDGTVNTSFVYAPYGEVVEATDGGAGVGAGKNAHRRRITDKYVDEIGGLTYFGARYYDGVMLGWTQGDPLYRFQPDAAWGAPRKGNLYQYVLANPVRFLDPDGRTGQATLAGAVTGGPVGAIIGFAVDLTIAATAGAVAGAVAFSMAHPQPGLCITGPESLYTCEETRVLFASPSVPGDVPKDTEAQHAQSLADARTQVGDTKTAQDSFGGPLDRVKPMSAAGKKSGGKSGAPAAGPRPEKSYYGGKKHGLKWTEASSRAKKTGNPQGKWGSEQDLDIATQNAATLGVGESGSFSLPANTTSTVTMPDGTVMQANSMTVINNGETWHGFPTVR